MHPIEWFQKRRGRTIHRFAPGAEFPAYFLLENDDVIVYLHSLQNKGYTYGERDKEPYANNKAAAAKRARLRSAGGGAKSNKST